MYFQNNALPRGNACLNCRKKKQKCDGVKPICHPCEKSGRGNVRSLPPPAYATSLTFSHYHYLFPFKRKLDCVYDEPAKSRQPPTALSINEQEVCSISSNHPATTATAQVQYTHAMASPNSLQHNHPHSGSTSSSGGSSTGQPSPGSRTHSGTALAGSGSSRDGSPALRTGTAVPGSTSRVDSS